jgi:hypothetical protein
MDEIFDVLTKHGVNVELHEEGSKSIVLITNSLSFNIITDLLYVGIKTICASTDGRIIIEA